MRIAAQIIIISAISVLTGFTYNHFRELPLPFFYKTLKIDPESILDLSTVESIFLKHEALFIDARTPEEHSGGHIPGSINIPAKWSRTKKIEILNTIPRDANIIVYCDNSNCTSAERLAGEINFMGFQHVSVFTDGWEIWQKNTTKKYHE